MIKSSVVKIHPPGTLCEKCGYTREEAKARQFECWPGGRHQWNKQEVKVTTKT